MQFNSKLYKLLGIKFGIESEGFLTTDNSGYKTAYAEDWLDSCDLLGCDGRSDTVEIRSDPLDNLHDIEINLTNTLKSYSDRLPEMKLIFAPYAEASTQSYMPCGLHITFTTSKIEFYSRISELYESNRFKKFIESKLPLKGVINEIEGILGEKRRNCSSYGNYEYGGFYSKRFRKVDTIYDYNSCDLNYDVGYEYRVFSSCLSNKDLFFKLVNSYIFLTFIYLYNDFYNNISSFKSDSNIFRRDLTKAVIDLKKAIVNKNIFDISEILKDKKYKVILDWWEGDIDSISYGHSIVDSMNKDNLIDGMDKSKVLIDIYDAWNIKREESTAGSYCDDCLRKYCQCGSSEYSNYCYGCDHNPCRCGDYCSNCDSYYCRCDEYCSICGEYTDGSCSCCYECGYEECCCDEEEVEV
jgi:hypothetical protein